MSQGPGQYQRSQPFQTQQQKQAHNGAVGLFDAVAAHPLCGLAACVGVCVVLAVAEGGIRALHRHACKHEDVHIYTETEIETERQKETQAEKHSLSLSHTRCLFKKKKGYTPRWVVQVNINNWSHNVVSIHAQHLFYTHITIHFPPLLSSPPFSHFAPPQLLWISFAA